jgi:hypothetical protein
MVAATSTIDPFKIPTITLSEDELDEVRAEMDAGRLPRDYLERYVEAVRKNVFGFDYQTARNGDPIEQGIGSPLNVTANDIAAYKKYGKDEIDFEKHLARKEKLFAEQEESRKKQAVAARVARQRERGRL